MESKVDVPCAQCGSDNGLSMLSMSSEIPYFGEHTQITVLCGTCGWKHTDFIPSEGDKHGYWSLCLESTGAGSARVVRSSSCTVRIRGLGLEVSPGGNSSGYITNVEGVIDRFEKAVKSMIRSLEDSDSLSEAAFILEGLSKAKVGRSDLVLELLDPRGSSQIIHESVISRHPTDEERSELELGPDLPIFEL